MRHIRLTGRRPIRRSLHGDLPDLPLKGSSRVHPIPPTHLPTQLPPPTHLLPQPTRIQIPTLLTPSLHARHPTHRRRRTQDLKGTPIPQ